MNGFLILNPISPLLTYTIDATMLLALDGSKSFKNPLSIQTTVKQNMISLIPSIEKGQEVCDILRLALPMLLGQADFTWSSSM